MNSNRRRLILCVAVLIGCAPFLLAAEDTLTKEQMKEFLLNAKVIRSSQSKKGITNPFHLVLSDGTTTHDGSFQSIDEHKPSMQFGNGQVEYNFVDSYKYNIAAYSLAELLGIEDMLPVYVDRKWKGEEGSLSWWLPVKMDEVERHRQKLTPPDADGWNNQMYKIRVFDQLVSDSDPNLTNVLIGQDWKLWRVDFTRAFRLQGKVKSPDDLVRCDRHLFEKLQALDGNDLEQRTKHYLNKMEVKAVMQRRDEIVKRFQKLIAEKGESEVLY